MPVVLVSEITQARMLTVHVTCAAVHVKWNVPLVQSPTGAPSSVEIDLPRALDSRFATRDQHGRDAELLRGTGCTCGTCRSWGAGRTPDGPVGPRSGSRRSGGSRGPVAPVAPRGRGAGGTVAPGPARGPGRHPWRRSHPWRPLRRWHLRSGRTRSTS